MQHDFTSWTAKLSERAVILFHDIDVHLEGFGVWRLWRELRESHPHFEFHHSHGLGLLAFGKEVSPAVAQLCAINATAEGAAYALE